MMITIIFIIPVNKEHCPRKHAESGNPEAGTSQGQAPIKREMNRLKTLCTAGALALLTAASATAQDGAAIFRQNCSACHKMGTRLVGPDLTGVTEKRSDAWIRKFISGSQAMIKSGDKDAVAIYEEYNRMMMTDFPLPEAEMTALIDYLASFSKKAEDAATADAAPEEEAAPIVYTDEDVEKGRRYYQGGLSGGGASCVSCHNVTAEGVIPGGLLAKDLTNVFSRMGHAGIAGILSAPPFPAMTAAYSGSSALTEEEIHALAAFLRHADTATPQAAAAGGHGTMLVWGGIGLAIILILIGITWRDRLHRSVRHDIDARQLKSI